jgi:hypothetical protein
LSRSLLPGVLALGAALMSSAACAVNSSGYAAVLPARAEDTLRSKAAELSAGTQPALVWGAVVPGFLSPRGLPPVQGQFSVTDTGLVFHAADGSAAVFPLVGPFRSNGRRRWRQSAVSLAYVEQARGHSVYLFRVDAGVFETDEPGPLLEVAAHPGWLDSLGTVEWRREQPLVNGSDSSALWTTARAITSGAYADSLYALFGRPRAPVGLIGRRGRMAGRLGEYIGSRDSLALDPAGMTGEVQLRHTLTHELAHRWQAQAKTQLQILWGGVPPIKDPKRYGYGDPVEQQAEAIAFAVNFLQRTRGASQRSAASAVLLDHYELLVPGTRTMVRYLAAQPLYRQHPLRLLLTRSARL